MAFSRHEFIFLSLFNLVFFALVDVWCYTLLDRSGTRLGCLSDIIVSLSAAVVLSAVVVVSCVGRLGWNRCCVEGRKAFCMLDLRILLFCTVTL